MEAHRNGFAEDCIRPGNRDFALLHRTDAPWQVVADDTRHPTCLIPTPDKPAQRVAIGKHNLGAQFVIVAYLWRFLSDNVSSAVKTVAFLTKT